MFKDDEGVLHVRSRAEVPEDYYGRVSLRPFQYDNSVHLDSEGYWPEWFYREMSVLAFRDAFAHGKEFAEKASSQRWKKAYLERIDEFYKYQKFMSKEDQEYAIRGIEHLIDLNAEQ